MQLCNQQQREAGHGFQVSESFACLQVESDNLEKYKLLDY